MKKVLWIVSYELPIVSYANDSKSIIVTGGWVTALSSYIIHNQKYELAICCPSHEPKHEKYKYNGVTFYTISYEILNAVNSINEVMDDYKPDILHVWGAEVAFSLPAIQAFSNPEHTIIHIQGFACKCYLHYNANLPWTVIYGTTVGELIRRNNIYKNKRKMLVRSKTEYQAMRLSGNFFGRTEFDRAACMEISPDSSYYHCGEIMREPFYHIHWDYNKCDKHRIFFSQGSKHLKGLHILIEAVKELVKKYEDMKIVVAGEDIYNYKNRRFGDKTYWRYLRRLIKESGLVGKVIFLGMIDGTSMAKEMANSSIFVSASACENSPNSVCEAMLIGLPVIASDVGGVSDLVTHKVDGFLYPFSEPYMLAHYIECLFSQKDIAIQISHNAKISMGKKCSPKVVVSEVISAYDNILRGV